MHFKTVRRTGELPGWRQEEDAGIGVTFRTIARESSWGEGGLDGME